MSELKKGMELTPIKIMLKQPNTDGNVYPVPCLVYIKDEADEVIAEKDTEIDGLKERIEVLNHQVCKMNCAMVKHYNEVCDDLIHNKYKRCLAMAMLCLREYLNCDKYKITFWIKWRKRWLKLANKFKEAK